MKAENVRTLNSKNIGPLALSAKNKAMNDAVRRYLIENFVRIFEITKKLKQITNSKIAAKNSLQNRSKVAAVSRSADAVMATWHMAYIGRSKFHHIFANNSLS